MNKYVIIAEDDEDDQFLLSSAWDDSELGVDYLFVKDGVELLEKLEHNPQKPEFVMMDLNMPMKNGREVLAEIRSSVTLKHLPVLIISTSQAPFDIASSYDAGANAYLVKPSTYTDLVTMINNTLKFWIKTASVPSE